MQFSANSVASLLDLALRNFKSIDLCKPTSAHAMIIANLAYGQAESAFARMPR